MRGIFLFVFFVLLTTHLLKAGEPTLDTWPGLLEGRCTHSPSISCNFLQHKLPVEDSPGTPLSTRGYLQKPSVVLPEIELGFFCLFELRLEKKFKLPVNFELK